jgi:hypothetical protein
MADTTLSPSRLWKRMNRTQRLAAARAFWNDEEATDDQVQAAMLIAQQKKFRVKTVFGLDLDRKTTHLASLASLPEQTAARVLIAYHLADHRPMMAAFLDAVGLEHDNGLIRAEEVKPDASKVAPAATKLAQEFQPEDVGIYLSTLLCQDPEVWGALRGLPELQGEGPATPA